MYVSKDIVKVNTVNKAVFAKTVNATETSLMINISSDKPQLFCVTLEVKDAAGNIRQVRRFFLFDNNTYILSRSDKPFYVSSASKSTDHTWQTHHNSTCLKWKNHFYNQFYFANKLLNEIESDPNGMISGIYEQTKGTLPVNGTSNVDGIVKFMVSYSSSSNINGSFSKEVEVLDLFSQSFCKTIAIKDGETYIFNVRAVDIVNNSLTEQRAVHIDSSLPVVNNIWLVKDGYQGYYVHSQTDLSRTIIQLNVYDLHSGIKMIEWFFGNSDSSDTIDKGSTVAMKLAQVVHKADLQTAQNGNCSV